MNLSQTRYQLRAKSHHAAGASIQELVGGRVNLDTYLREDYHHKGRDAIYIHVPFCTKICSFCNMRRSLAKPTRGYGDLVEEQIKKYSQYDAIQSKDYDSVYFGGGTPTALPVEELRTILRALKSNLPITKEAEISVETTITELDQEKMEMFREEGVNRFSIGVQTFSNQGRQTLGRKGDRDLVINKINQLLDMDFSNVNIDLIYNYPKQSIEEIYQDIEIASSLDIAGFSYYSLILNDQAKLRKAIKNADNYYDDNTMREMQGFNIITEEAQKNGFDFLELTKMVRPGRDDYKYIKIRNSGGSTLPLGAGAGGNLGHVSLMNEIKIDNWAHQVKNFEWVEAMGFKPAYGEIKTISAKLQFAKLDMREIQDDYLRTKVREFFKALAAEGFMFEKNDVYYLTKKGIFWGNNICRELAGLVQKIQCIEGKALAL